MEVGEPQQFVNRLEQLSFSRELSDGTLSEKADVVRNILVHQCVGMASDLFSDTGLTQLQSQYVDMYRNLVDNFDQEQGLNNFAEGALASCSLHRNESQAWRSSLTAERFLSSLHGRQLKEACQASSDQLMPPGKEREMIKLRPRDQITEKVSMSAHSVVSIDENSATSTQKTGVSLFREQKSDRQNLSANVNLAAESNNNVSKPWSNGSFHRFTDEQPQFGQNKFSDLQTVEHEVRDVHTGPSSATLFQMGFVGGGENRNIRYPNLSKPAFSHQLQGGQCSPDGAGPRFSPNPPNDFGATRQGNSSRGNQYGNYGDQEVPRKPLFPTTGSAGMSAVGSGYGCFNPQQPSTNKGNFCRRAETGKRPYNNNLEEEEGEEESPCMGPFKTAKEQMSINQQKKYGQNHGPVKPAAYGNVKKSLGTRRGPSSKFVPPVMNREESEDSNVLLRKAGPNKSAPDSEEPIDERLKGLEPKMIELIMNEIMDHGPPLSWSDIAGLDFAKKTIKEIVVWPMLRPDIFTGLRGPPKGLLLFGPPGTGKTLIGKCIASQSKSTFFSISASSLTSKWVGEGEKMVRALFAVSRCHQPAVIFIDEIDSLLSQRTDGEHEASRRIKTEFLIQLDGVSTELDERILVIGATNRPQEIDEAARRRFVKRLYIPLPEGTARRQIILNLLTTQRYHLTEEELESICVKTVGYSGSDMANLCREAALGPIRSIEFGVIEQITADQVRPILFQDFDDAILQVRASVSAKDLDVYIDWNKLFGCGGR